MSLRHRPDLVTRTVDGELIILDRSTETVHHLNHTATYIWCACDGTHSADDIAASLACKAAVKINMKLTPEKMQWLIDRLLRTSSPTTDAADDEQ